MNWQQKSKLVADPVCAPCDCSPEDVDYDSGRLETVNRHFQSLIEEGAILSGSYCLWRRGRIFADAALGNLACPWQGRERFMPDTFFELQSVAKSFTAVAILKLTEDGMLYLGQPVRDWIPEFSAEGFRDITITHLLTHTSGLCALPGAWPKDERNWWENMDTNHVGESWLRAVIETGLHAKPGEKWIYSCAGYAVLGEIIGRAAGMRAEEYIRQNIFIPCGMTESHWRKDAAEEWIKRYNICKPYDVDLVKEYEGRGTGDFSRPVYQWWDEIPETAGGVMSTSREMVRFGEMLLRGGSYRGNRVIGRTACSYLWENLAGSGLVDHCWDHPGYPVVYGAGMPIMTRRNDLWQTASENVIYHEGSGLCVFLVDREEDFIAMFQASFPGEDDWRWEAAKGTISVLWSGLK